MKDAILGYLKLTGNVKRINLLRYLQSGGFHVSDRELRATIADMIETDGHLITSSAKGYKLCETVKEYEKAIAYVTSYAMALLKKRRALKRNYMRLIKPQLFV